LNDYVAQLVEQLTFKEWKGVWAIQNFIENWKNCWGYFIPEKGGKAVFSGLF
jgi:hypothetical protein